MSWFRRLFPRPIPIRLSGRLVRVERTLFFIKAWLLYSPDVPRNMQLAVSGQMRVHRVRFRRGDALPTIGQAVEVCVVGKHNTVRQWDPIAQVRWVERIRLRMAR